LNLEGGCSFAALRYKLTASPLIVHACHCRDCQRVTGSAFVTNIWIEKQFVETNGATPKSCMLRGGSGKKHEVFRKRSSPTFTSSRGASCRGWIFQRAFQLLNPS